ncbi:phage head-tail adapter protein [Solibacillus sp. FSL W7-1436]|uniref:phage head-tail adapter protein n=1 Tax=Solibacillus sp. FSL W7-1436 TaxID=2921705 RepID=UPI0030F76EEB
MSMFKDVIQLVGYSIELDEMMQEVKTPYERQVFANKRSVSQTEFFNGGQGGLKPQYQFEIRLSEFNGESELVHEGKTYSVYRTYENGENIELYSEVRVGGY